jgi:hypothetical protein
MAVRAPHLYHPLRCFCLAAFALLAEEVERGAEIPFAFEEHASPGRPSLYEYRPLVRRYVESRGRQLAALRDARIALSELACEPAAAIFARAHGEAGLTEEDALFRTALLPIVVLTAEGCGGFDWHDGAFDRAYAELERSLFRERRAYAAVAPVIGLSLGTPVELGGGLRIRPAAAGELAAHWPEAQGLLPPDFGREPDRLCLIELECDLPTREPEPPDAPGELADAITAVRLATAGPVAAGPILFERLDWRPFGIRPMLPIAATQPSGDPIRLDQVRGSLARDLRDRLAGADDDLELAEALDRWELSLFQTEPFRSEQLREALAAALGGPDGLWAAAVRAAVLLGESGQERGDLLERLRALAAGEAADEGPADALRRVLVELLMHGDRAALVRSLDEALLGVRPRPAGYFAARASALAV